jgi:hypothetical protein
VPNRSLDMFFLSDDQIWLQGQGAIALSLPCGKSN